MNANTIYKVTVRVEMRDDGGVRVWSEDLPELVLSHADADQVYADVPRAIEAILSDRFGAAVRAEILVDLRSADAVATPTADRLEFAARAA